MGATNVLRNFDPVGSERIVPVIHSLKRVKTFSDREEEARLKGRNLNQNVDPREHIVYEGRTMTVCSTIHQVIPSDVFTPIEELVPGTA